jgi:hypothetical protein
LPPIPLTTTIPPALFAESFGAQQNACGFNGGDVDGHFKQHFASITSKHYSHDVCGKCVRVSGATGKAVLFKIVDECASGCGDHGLDFSMDGLKAVTGYSWDKKKVTWEFADCGGAAVMSSRKSSKKGRKMLEAGAAVIA